MIVEGRIIMGSFFAGIISRFGKFLGSQNSLYTVGILMYENEMPRELL